MTKENKIKKLFKTRTNNVKEKQTGEEELGTGFSSIIKGTADSLFNCLAAGSELVLSGVSKVSEKLGSEDPEIVSHRQKLVDHHMNQMKQSLNRAKDSAISVGKGGFHTIKGAIRTVLTSGKDTIKGLRENKKENKKGKTSKTVKINKNAA